MDPLHGHGSYHRVLFVLPSPFAVHIACYNFSWVICMLPTRQTKRPFPFGSILSVLWSCGAVMYCTHTWACERALKVQPSCNIKQRRRRLLIQDRVVRKSSKLPALADLVVLFFNTFRPSFIVWRLSQDFVGGIHFPTCSLFVPRGGKIHTHSICTHTQTHRHEIKLGPNTCEPPLITNVICRKIGLFGSSSFPL